MRILGFLATTLGIITAGIITADQYYLSPLTRCRIRWISGLVVHHLARMFY
jgi:hypothetical protein